MNNPSITLRARSKRFGHMSRAQMIFSYLKKMIDFFQKQTNIFKILLFHRIENSLSISLKRQYESLYVVSLGASIEQVGLLNSIGTISNLLFSLPFGWLVDRYDPKLMVLIGMMGQLVSSMIYTLANNWMILLVAALFGTFLFSPLTLITSVMIANSLKKKDRATGMSLIGSISTIPSLIAPLIAAYTLGMFGGISAKGIRPLYWMILLLQLFVFIYVFIRMEVENNRRESLIKGKFSPIKDFRALIDVGTALKRAMVCRFIDGLTFGMIGPYISLYAVEVKNATPLILGITGVVSSLGALIFTIPIGRLADRIGRKKTMILITKPLYLLSSFLFMFAPNPEFLIIPFFLQSMDVAFIIVWQTLEMELVPFIHRGKWSSLIMFSHQLGWMPAPILGSLIWTSLTPNMIFIIHIILNIGVFLPLFITIPETLSLRKD
jgi:MFS family permease